ncbi:hypothetical protein PSTG_16764 [Puccinia striiformis f. sp. tritici PST-78]|uniref:Uncharacterized protein n=1 Tax=Puccinia striiformis f. sp. tritici PST-78 TaxID=1165861 RepID=A0A0L0US12_9BASI|nr:hypothetical protein PSTG_16764 [Puccinia striiformis f. sp. tritici PST-78]
MASILGKDFTFSGCDQWGELAPTGKVDQSFYVEHFVADNTARTVQAHGVDGFYYHCTFDKPTDFNARRPTCSNCKAP